VRREVRNLTVMGMDPNQTTEQAALVKELERSARVEQRLRKMALDYAVTENLRAVRPSITSARDHFYPTSSLILAQEAQ